MKGGRVGRRPSFLRVNRQDERQKQILHCVQDDRC
jgi:hypothetical protein